MFFNYYNANMTKFTPLSVKTADIKKYYRLWTYIKGETPRNLLVSFICGLLFGLAWWLMIDILSLYKEVRTHRHGIFFLPILLSSVSLFLNSAVPNSSLVDVYSLTKRIFVHRFIFFLSTAIGFSGFISSIIICSVNDAASLPLYALIGVPLLNAFILISNLAFKFGVVDEDDIFL